MRSKFTLEWFRIPRDRGKTHCALPRHAVLRVWECLEPPDWKETLPLLGRTLVAKRMSWMGERVMLQGGESNSSRKISTPTGRREVTQAGTKGRARGRAPQLSWVGRGSQKQQRPLLPGCRDLQATRNPGHSQHLILPITHTL